MGSTTDRLGVGGGEVGKLNKSAPHWILSFVQPHLVSTVGKARKGIQIKQALSAGC